MSRPTWGRRLEDFILLDIAPPLGSWLIRGLYHSLRVKQIDFHKVEDIFKHQRSFIGAFWHNQLLLMPCFQRDFTPGSRAILISKHRDGEIITRIAARFGYASIRGSKTRGGFGALRQTLKFIREGNIFVITPDGPRGPKYKVKPNVIDVARATGVPIVPFAFSAKTVKTFASWDAFILPCPFTRAAFVWGEPLRVSGQSSEEEMEAARQRLEDSLNELTVRAQEAARGKY